MAPRVEPSEVEGAPEQHRAGLALALVLVVLAAALAWPIDASRTWGWDESMHAELPAARMALHVQRGEANAAAGVLLGCEQYPFAVPLLLALPQLASGPSESVARRTTRATSVLAVIALALIAARLARDANAGTVRRIGTPVLSMVFLFGLSPLFATYSATLFLEVPFACAMLFTLLAWLGLDERRGARRELLAGAGLALCFFTKFNYGLLLGAGLALDFLIQSALRATSAGWRAIAVSALHLACVPALACLWWFVLPLPAGLETGTAHREALAGFLAGNQDSPRIPFELRLFDWAAGGFRGPAVLAAMLVGASFALTRWREHATRLLLLILFVFLVPGLAHPFHLDRFLVPQVPLVCLLAASGWSLAFQAKPILGTLAFASIVALGSWLLDAGRLLELTGLAHGDPAVRAYQQSIADARVRGWFSSELPTAGLERREADALLDLAAREVGPSARVAWIGISSELSPAALHLGLLERGGSVERFLADAHRPLDLTFEGEDPQVTTEELARFAGEFDVVLGTEPADLSVREKRAFCALYRRRLVLELGWSERELGAVEIHKAGRAPYPVRLFACRPPPR